MCESVEDWRSDSLHNTEANKYKADWLPWHCITTTVLLLILTHSYSLTQISRPILSLDISGPTTHRAICFLWPPPSRHPHIQICRTASTWPVSLLICSTGNPENDRLNSGNITVWQQKKQPASWQHPEKYPFSNLQLQYYAVFFLIILSFIDSVS